MRVPLQDGFIGGRRIGLRSDGDVGTPAVPFWVGGRIEEGGEDQVGWGGDLC